MTRGEYKERLAKERKNIYQIMRLCPEMQDRSGIYMFYRMDENGKVIARYIPNHHYVQVCDQLGVTDFDFVVLQSQLIFQDGHSEIRQYYIERDEAESDIAYVQSEAVKFWGYVTSGKHPPTILEI